MSRILSDQKGKLFKPKYRKQKNDMRGFIADGDKSTKRLSDLSHTNFESTSSFRYEINSPIKSTQQLNVDYNLFENHTFFHSAVAKTNEAFLKIINEYPFDGSLKKIEAFEDELTGFESHILKKFPKNVGYLIFSGTQKGEAATNGTQINVLDQDGARIKTLAKENSNSETLDPLNQSATFQFYINPAAKINDNQIIFQKKSSLANNMTMFLSESNDVNKCNINFGITSGSFFNSVTTTINKGSFSFVTAGHNIDKSRLTLTIYDNNDNKTIVTSSNITNFKELKYFGADLNIASGENFRFNELIVAPQETFSGSIDEFRYYHRVLTDQEVLLNKNKIVNGDKQLQLYYKFNEPYGSYEGNDIALDSSINSRSEKIKNFIISNRLTGSDSPLAAEDINRSPVLMPQFDKIQNLNSRMLVTASNYDNVNPNLITRLVPKHYLQSGNDLEGYSSNFGSLSNTVANSKNIRDGINTPTSAQLMIKFLLTWGKYFDELKMYIDSLSLFKTINYQDLDTVPDAFLKKLSNNLGIELPNLFSPDNFEAFFNGYDYQNNDGKSSLSLFQIQNLIWRRVLSEFPSHSSTKGTLDNIKGIFRNVGIEPDNIFHVREYGGAKQKSLNGSKVLRKDEVGFLAFTGSIGNENQTKNYQGRPTVKSPYVVSSFLSGSRIEPGLPKIQGNAVNISNTNPHGTSNNRSDGLFTTASFDYHATYIYPTSFTHFDSQSLVRLHVTGTSAPSNKEGCIINLVSNNTDSTLSLYINDSPSKNTVTTLFLTGVNIDNGDIWAINFGRKASNDNGSIAKNSEFYLRASTFEPGIEPIVYYTSSIFKEESDSLFSNFSTTYNSSGSFLTIGSQSFEDTTRFINKGTAAQKTTNFSGFVTSINFWSKDYSNEEFLSYLKNPNSYASANPVINYNFLHQNSGSFKQVKLHTFSKQATTSSNASGNINLFDLSQRNNHISGYNFEPNKKVIKNRLTILEKLSENFDLNSSNKKIRIRGIQDPALLASNEFATTSPVYEVDPAEEVFDDMRFSLDISAAKGLNENILNVFSDFQFLEDSLGSPNLIFSDRYPNLVQLRKVYFNNLLEKMDLNRYKSLFKWLDNAFTDIVFSSLPRNTKFMGINFLYESHVLERNRFKYLHDEIYLKSLPRDPSRGNIFLSQFVGKIKKG